MSPLGRPGQLAATVLAAPERLAARQPRSAKAKATQHRRRGRGWGRRGRGRMRRSGAFRSDGTSAFRLTRPLDQLFRPFDPDQGSPTLNRVCTDFPDPLVTRMKRQCRSVNRNCCLRIWNLYFVFQFPNRRARCVSWILHGDIWILKSVQVPKSAARRGIWILDGPRRFLETGNCSPLCF